MENSLSQEKWPLPKKSISLFLYNTTKFFFWILMMLVRARASFQLTSRFPVKKFQNKTTKLVSLRVENPLLLYPFQHSTTWATDITRHQIPFQQKLTLIKMQSFTQTVFCSVSFQGNQHLTVKLKNLIQAAPFQRKQFSGNLLISKELKLRPGSFQVSQRPVIRKHYFFSFILWWNLTTFYS